MTNIYSYPYSPGLSILYSPIARKILLLSATEAAHIEHGLLHQVSPATAQAFAQLNDYVPVSQQPKVMGPADYTLLTVLPTNRCNFACSYCYAAAGRDNSSLDLPRLQKVIDFFFDSKPAGLKRPLSLSFMGGGEPLMAFDVVRTATEYARQKSLQSGLRLNIRIITNASLVDDEFIRFCKSQDVEVSVSFDVIKDVHDVQRDRYDDVVRGLTALCDAGLSVQVNTTITPLNVAQMPSMLSTIHDRWPTVQAVMFEPVSGRLGMDNAQLEAFLGQYGQQFITCLHLADSYGISLTSFAYLRTVFPLERACPGELCITSHADVTGCYCVGSPKAPLYAQTKYGEVHDWGLEFDEEQYHRLTGENVYSFPECTDCEVKWNCGGGCYYQNHTSDADYRLIQCRFTRRFVQDIIGYRVDRHINQCHGQTPLPLLIDNR